MAPCADLYSKYPVMASSSDVFDGWLGFGEPKPFFLCGPLLQKDEASHLPPITYNGGLLVEPTGIAIDPRRCVTANPRHSQRDLSPKEEEKSKPENTQEDETRIKEQKVPFSWQKLEGKGIRLEERGVFHIKPNDDFAFAIEYWAPSSTKLKPCEEPKETPDVSRRSSPSEMSQRAPSSLSSSSQLSLWDVASAPLLPHQRSSGISPNGSSGERCSSAPERGCAMPSETKGMIIDPRVYEQEIIPPFSGENNKDEKKHYAAHLIWVARRELGIRGDEASDWNLAGRALDFTNRKVRLGPLIGLFRAFDGNIAEDNAINLRTWILNRLNGNVSISELWCGAGRPRRARANCCVTLGQTYLEACSPR